VLSASVAPLVLPRSSSGVSICTVVLVKQVNLVPGLLSAFERLAQA
jgi:hypothetical protein